jgi:diguanylate cyclase (GGDEF)-like protein
MNHKNRSIGFAMLALVLGMHMLDMGVGAWGWVLLVAQFGLYPHFAFAVARRSAKPLAAEIRNMRIDALCFGAWAAALQFPLWIGFILWVGASQNLAAFKGNRGYFEAAVLLVVGALVPAWWQGWAIRPETTPLTTGLAILTVLLYLRSAALDAYRRSMRLHTARAQLRASESALHTQLAEIQSLHEKLSEQANRDGLTGLYNRRYMDEALSRELARSVREGQPAALLLIDIDHFKQINDDKGHQVGDQILQHVAHLLADRVRSSDLVCRYGGEEFLVWLPGMQLEDARAMAELLRIRCESAPLLMEGVPVMATLSIGVAAYPQDAQQIESLISQADRSLYLAKHQGRNRVCVAQPTLLS